jgi:DNA-binding CsgD family transcriptional regulator
MSSQQTTAVERNPVLYWFRHEVEYLRRHWSVKTTAQIAADLGRTYHSVRRKAAAIGLRRPAGTPRRWTDERKARFMAACDRSPVQAAREFGIRPNTVRTYRETFRGKSSARPKMAWTAHERTLIRDLYPQGKIDELRSRLPHRSRHAINLIASRSMGKTLSRYLTDEERQIIASEYRSAGAASLAARLAMTPNQVRAHANRLGVSKVASRSAEASHGRK